MLILQQQNEFVLRECINSFLLHIAVAVAAAAAAAA